MSASPWECVTRHKRNGGPVYYALPGGERELFTLVRPTLVGPVGIYHQDGDDGELGDQEFAAELALAEQMDDGRVPLTPAETLAKTTKNLNDLAKEKLTHPIWECVTRHKGGAGPVYYQLWSGARSLYTLVRPTLVCDVTFYTSEDGELGDQEFAAELALAEQMDDGRVPLTPAETLAKTTKNLNDLAKEKLTHPIWECWTRHKESGGIEYYALLGVRKLYTLVRPTLVGPVGYSTCDDGDDGELGDHHFAAELALAEQMDDGRVPLTPAETLAKTTKNLNDLAATKMAHPIWKSVTRHKDGAGAAFYRRGARGLYTLVPPPLVDYYALLGGERELFTLVRPTLVGLDGMYLCEDGDDGERADQQFAAELALAEQMDDGRVPLTPAETLTKTTHDLNDLALPSDAAGETASALPSVEPKADDIPETAATAHDRPASTTSVPAKKQRTEGPASPGVEKKKTGGGASGGAASDKDKSKYSGSACEMCDKETVAIFTARKHFLQCDTKDGRQHYLNIEYLKKQPKDASLVAPHKKFKTQTVLLDGQKKALDLTEKASADKPKRVFKGHSDPNPFVCADCYVGFLVDYQKK